MFIDNSLVISEADRLVYFDELMDESSLSSCVKVLEKDYQDGIQNKGDLDERIFVNNDERLLGSGSLSSGATNLNGGKMCYIIDGCHFVKN